MMNLRTVSFHFNTITYIFGDISTVIKNNFIKLLNQTCNKLLHLIILITKGKPQHANGKGE